MSFFKKILSLGLLILIISSPEIISQRKVNAYLKNYTSQILTCGSQSDKEFNFAIEAGRIYAADSCYGFDFEIGFNPAKVRISDKLIQNTLAELFEVSDATSHKEGYVRGYAGQLKIKNPVYGDRPLMAFLGNFINDCEDTTEITLRFLDFTEEFKGTVDSVKNVTLSIVKNQKAKDSVITSADASVFNFLGIEKKQISIIIKLNSIKAYKNLNLSLIKNVNSNFKISNFKVVQPDNFEIESIFEQNDTINLMINRKSEKLIETLIIEADAETISNSNDNTWINLKSIVLDDCNCNVINKGLDINLISTEKKDTLSVVEENDFNDLLQMGNKLQVNRDISKISIYDVCGILISEISIENNSLIELNKLNNGLYFIVYDKNGKRINRKIFINKL